MERILKKGQSIIFVIPRLKKKMLGQEQSLETKTREQGPLEELWSAKIFCT